MIDVIFSDWANIPDYIRSIDLEDVQRISHRLDDTTTTVGNYVTLNKIYNKKSRSS